MYQKFGGICMAGNDYVDNTGAIYPDVSPLNEENCLAECLKVKGAKACQYDGYVITCYALLEKGEAVTGGDGEADRACWKFSAGQGKSRYFQKKIEFKVPHRCHYADMKNFNQIIIITFSMLQCS